jgi:hypothetical protein
VLDRSAAHRRQTLARRTWAVVQRPLMVAVSVTVVLRVGTTLVALVSAYGVVFPHVVARHPGVLAGVWDQWDTQFYSTIAQHGYVASRGPLRALAVFGPAYPYAMKVVRHLTGTNWLWAAQIVSFMATIVGISGLILLCDRDQDVRTSNAAVMALVSFPTAFFLLAGYPESLALVFVVGAFLAARRGHWVLAGLAAMLAAMTVYYLVIILAALLVEFWQSRPSDERWFEDWRHDLVRPAALVAPSVVFFALWMVVNDHLYGDPLEFVHAQQLWGRHFAYPWTLFHQTASILIHLQFLDTGVASFVELFDAVTMVLLAVMTVYVFLKVRRSYGVLLGVSWVFFCCQSILKSETREVLVLFPLFMGLGRWVAGHPWRERLVLACFLPSAYFLIERFATDKFAG